MLESILQLGLQFLKEYGLSTAFVVALLWFVNRQMNTMQMMIIDQKDERQQEYSAQADERTIQKEAMQQRDKHFDKMFDTMQTASRNQINTETKVGGNTMAIHEMAGSIETSARETATALRENTTSIHQQTESVDNVDRKLAELVEAIETFQTSISKDGVPISAECLAKMTRDMAEILQSQCANCTKMLPQHLPQEVKPETKKTKETTTDA